MLEQILQTSRLEWTAFLLAVFQVVLAACNKPINFVAGFCSTILYTYILWKYGLFAEASLNVYYAFISLWGLYIWFGKTAQTPLAISITTFKEKINASIIFIISFILFVAILTKYTTSTVPIWDSFAAALGWTGAWLMAKRKIENWGVLNASNLVSIGLFYYKGLVLTSLLSVILFVVAVFGWWQWRKLLATQFVNQLLIKDK